MGPLQNTRFVRPLAVIFGLQLFLAVGLVASPESIEYRFPALVSLGVSMALVVAAMLNIKFTRKK